MELGRFRFPHAVAASRSRFVFAKPLSGVCGTISVHVWLYLIAAACSGPRRTPRLASESRVSYVTGVLSPSSDRSDEPYRPEGHVWRNLVVCSDGTGNTFRQHVSNVSLLVQALDLAHPDDQIAFYDQGIGTTPSLVESVKAFKNSGGSNRKALKILPPPKVPVSRSLAKFA